MSNATISHPELLSQIFRSDYSWLTDRLRHRLGCRYSAEDVASETFLQLASSAPLDTVRDSRAILTTIANRVVYRGWRRRVLEKAYQDALASAPEQVQPSAEETYLLLESIIAIDVALQGLSEKARRAFLMSQIDGMTYAQIGGELGVSSSMVRQYMSKALMKCYEASIG